MRTWLVFTGTVTYEYFIIKVAIHAHADTYIVSMHLLAMNLFIVLAS